MTNYVTIRCPDDLRARIAKAAEKERRSVSQWCRLKLEEALATTTRAPKNRLDKPKTVS